MIPLNEYPKEELLTLLQSVEFTADFDLRHLGPGHADEASLNTWISILRESISDQEFKEKELPFKTE